MPPAQWCGVGAARMKIVSLLPSATEIVFALGLGDSLEGRSFECDFPAAAEQVPIVSGTALPVDEHLTAREIDDAVSTRVAAGESIYTLDAERIRAIQPDVILAQDLCEVCAVPSGAVTDALEVLGCHADVVSLDPSSLDDVIACIGQVGAVTGTRAAADEIMRDLRARVTQVRKVTDGLPARRALALEWADPPFNGGHWIPDMLLAAGAEPLLSPPGARSRRMEWPEIADTAPDVVLFMPCGYSLDGAVEEGAALLDQPALAAAAEIWALDANAYFSRPGPRVVDGVELLASVLHPDSVPPHAGATRLR
jgi:iron complex transport system substrate-binding protein